ncbi:MAG: hypothetical protein LBC20_01900 [Planctomycetaceae bacterium]|nr:hypothetical protein [Planctomycetaceae bacterium]
MSQSNGFMPRKDGEFLAWAKTIYHDCSENTEVWEISPEAIDQISDLVETAEAAYQVNIDKEYRNKATAKAKDAAFVALKQFLSAFVNTLEGNLLVPDAAIDAMGLRPRHPHAHQPIPLPDEAPVFTAVVGQHHDVTGYVSTLQHGRPTQYLKDGKYAGFVLKYLVEGETQWQTIVSTRLHYTLIFSDEYEGKYIRMQAAWINPRIQSGPWSEEVRELIN